MLTNALSAKAVATLKDGKHRDGQGLQFEVKGGSRRWTFSYMFAGRQRELAIRKYPTMSLADARAKRAELREAKHRGLDPRAFWLEQPSQTARSRSAKIYSRSSPTCAASGRRAI
jgi:hypothetical protein